MILTFGPNIHFSVDRLIKVELLNLKKTHYIKFQKDSIYISPKYIIRLNAHFHSSVLFSSVCKVGV